MKLMSSITIQLFALDITTKYNIMYVEVVWCSSYPYETIVVLIVSTNHMTFTAIASDIHPYTDFLIG